MMLRPRQKLFVERSLAALDAHALALGRPVTRALAAELQDRAEPE